MFVNKAFKNILKHPIILLPDLFLTISVFLIAKLTILLTGIQEIIPEVGEVSKELISAFFKENLFQVLWPVLLFFFTTFILGVVEKVIKLELISSIIKNNKPSLLKAWKNRFHYIFRVIFLKIILFLIIFIAAALIFGIIGIVIYLLVTPFNTASQLPTIITLLLFITVLVLIKLCTLFIYPILFMTETKNSFEIIKKSFNLFKKHKKYTFRVWLTMMIVAFFFGILSLLISLPQIQIFSYLIVLIGIVYQVWSDMYIFLEFKSEFLRSP